MMLSLGECLFFSNKNIHLFMSKFSFLNEQPTINISIIQETDSCFAHKRCLRQGGDSDSRHPWLSEPQFSLALGKENNRKIGWP